MPTTCLAALIKRLRGIWEWYRLRAEAAKSLSRRRPLFPFRREDAPGQKETQTAQGSKELKKLGRPDSRVTVEAAPRARTTDFGKGGVAADIFGHRHPGGIRKSG